MVIGIESVYGDKRLSGRNLSADELRSIVKDILSKTDEKNFVSTFCNKLKYTELPDSEGYVAYMIDLDTRKIYSPSYTFPRELDGAKVLFYTDKGHFSPVLYPGGAVADYVFYLAICKYSDSNEYYIFHCNESFEVVADDCLSNLKMCKKYMEDFNIVWHEYSDNK